MANQEIRDITFNLQVRTEDGKVKIEGLTKGFVKSSTAIKKMQDELDILNEKVKGTGVSSGLANTAVLEFGRTISDAPYGIQGMGNNLTQLTTILGQMSNDVKEGETVIGNLIKSFIGPLGIVVAVQIAIAAFEIFRKSQREAADALKEFNAEAILQGKTLEGLRKEFLNSESPLERRLMLLKSLATGEENLRKILELKNVTEEEQVALADQYIKRVILLEEKERELLQAKKDIEDSNKDLEISEESLQRKRDRRALLLNTQNANVARQREYELTSLEKEIELIEELLPVLNKLGAGLNYVASEREAAMMDATQRTNYIFLTPKEAKEQEKMLDSNLKVFNSYIQKAKELRAENEIAALESQRAYEIASLKQGKGYNQARQAIIEYYAVLIKQTEDKLAKESAEREDKIAQDKRNSDLKVFLSRKGHNIRMAELEAKLADKRLKEILDTEKKQLDSDIRVLESRIKILRILAATDEEAGRKLDEALIVLDDLRIRRSNIAETEKDTLKAAVDGFIELASSLNGVLQAQAEREIAIQQNKTTALNDELRKRLANEQLSAEERDKINQQIARNEAALVEKENEINEKRFKQQKAVQMAQAIVEVYRNAFLAYGSQLVIGDPTSAVRAQIAKGVALAAGLANVAMIAKQKYVRTEMPSPMLTSQGGGAAMMSPSFNVVGASQQTQIAQALASMQDKPIKAYVVESEVTTAQEMARKTIVAASI